MDNSLLKEFQGIAKVVSHRHRKVGNRHHRKAGSHTRNLDLLPGQGRDARDLRIRYLAATVAHKKLRKHKNINIS